MGGVAVLGEEVWFHLADEGMLDIREMYCRIGKVNNYHMSRFFLARVQIPPATLWNGAVRWCLCLNYSWSASMSGGVEREEEEEEEEVTLLVFLCNLLLVSD